MAEEDDDPDDTGPINFDQVLRPATHQADPTHKADELETPADPSVAQKDWPTRRLWLSRVDMDDGRWTMDERPGVALSRWTWTMCQIVHQSLNQSSSEHNLQVKAPTPERFCRIEDIISDI